MSAKIKTDKPILFKDYGEDPDAKRKEEVKDAIHKNWLLFHKWLPIFSMGLLILLIILTFGILPISEMSTEFDNTWEVVVNYTQSFREVNRTIGIALATIIVSDLLKRLYEYIKENVNNRQ